MNKPIIGISTNLLKIKEKPFLNFERNYVNRSYIDQIVNSGGIPMMIPLLTDHSMLEQLLSLVDGVLMTGGQDLEPSFYKEAPHPLLGETAKERDEWELSLVHHAFSKNKPILGICRGMQLMNVAFGGSLYQDLSLQPSTDHPRVDHSQEAAPDRTSHAIELTYGSKLQHILNQKIIYTNSFHHQAVKELAPGFIISAKSLDGVVEAIEKTNSASWVMGVQWHPETMPLSHCETSKLFAAFISEAMQHRRRL